MLFDWIRKKFWWLHSGPVPSAPVAEEEDGEAPTSGEGFFSTHRHEEGRGIQNRLRIGSPQWLEARMGKFRELMPVAQYDAAAGTMDDDGNGGYPAKANFSIAQPNMSELLVSWYGLQTFIGHQLCAVIAQHWLVWKACEMPARDAIRNGYDIVDSTGEEISPEILHYMRKLDKKFKVKAKVRDFVTMGRVFGIRVAIYKVDSPDPDYYKYPFNIDGVRPGAYKGIVLVDPYWMAPMLDSESSSQPDSENFYEPTWWQINGTLYHRSHLVIFRHGKVADFMKPAYIYSGVPMPQQIAERIYAAERTANEGPMLAMTKRMTIFKTNLSEFYANFQKSMQRMAEWIGFRDNYQIKVASIKDEIQQTDTALGDLDSVIMTQYQIVAAIAGVPATKLLGTVPKGFNSTGDYEADSYDEYLESMQANDMQDFIEKHHRLQMRSHVLPKFGIEIDTEIIFRPVRRPKAEDLAQMNLQKSQEAQALADTGAIDAADIRQRLRDDPESGWNSLSDEMPLPEVEDEETNNGTAENQTSAE